MQTASRLNSWARIIHNLHNSNWIDFHIVQTFLYANNIQSYTSFMPSDSSSSQLDQITFQSVHHNGIQTWMTENILKLNNDNCK